jgi:hypothetical protein
MKWKRQSANVSEKSNSVESSQLMAPIDWIKGEGKAGAE